MSLRACDTYHMSHIRRYRFLCLNLQIINTFFVETLGNGVEHINTCLWFLPFFKNKKNYYVGKTEIMVFLSKKKSSQTCVYIFFTIFQSSNKKYLL